MATVRPYHHGDLRTALLRAAEILISEVGPSAFTLREVARRAGVSHNAPYRHFKSRQDLLLAVAAEGLERLRATMSERMECSDSPRERLVLCGYGYVEFALRWPQHFIVMFDLAGLRHEEREGKRVPSIAFQVLLDAITASQQAGVLPPGDPLPLAWTAWSMVHGIAKLAAGGNLAPDQATLLNFTRRATECIAWGMERYGKEFGAG